ncbi:MarR family winged helix-turn-helix transcriptional regulator [Nonomuraea sp. NPDC049309]|uniref:MarR family winged helix-turn-helix transcriptional regulator n=1 Tax=Nonomuraea sp. NPDC049309 TaxID=3364350 RepID=UPI00371558EF
MTSGPSGDVPDLDRPATTIEDFNTYDIRLPPVRRLNFSALSVLHTLSRKGEMRLTDLTATEQLKQPALTGLVAKLEREGPVSRRPDPRDGRAVLLSLTPEGRRIAGSRRADRVARLRRLVEYLDGDDRAALADVMRVLGRLTEIAARLEDRS